MSTPEDKLTKLSEAIAQIHTKLNEIGSKIAVMESRAADTREYIDGAREVIEDTKTLLNEEDKKVSLLSAFHTTTTETIRSVKDQMETKYVSKSEFEPVKRIVYAVATTVGVSFIGALFKLLVH